MGFGKKMKKMWDVGFSGKRRKSAGSGWPLPDSDNYCIPLLVTSPRTRISSPGGGGYSTYERGGDARCLA